MMSEQTIKAPLTPADPAAGDILALVQDGKDALAAGRLEDALDRFEEVIRRFPDSREGHNNLGALYATLGRHEKAERCFSRVLDLAPGTPNVHYNRGLSRTRLRRYVDAITDFEAVLRAQPTDADSWNNLGVAHFLNQDHAAAAANFRQALTLTPNYPNAVLNLADAEAARGRAAAAVAACEEFLDGREDAEVAGRLVELLCDETVRLARRTAATAEARLAPHGETPEACALVERARQAAASLASTESA